MTARLGALLAGPAPTGTDGDLRSPAGLANFSPPHTVSWRDHAQTCSYTCRSRDAHPACGRHRPGGTTCADHDNQQRSEEHKSELQSLMRTPYAVSCSKTKIVRNIELKTNK